MRKSKELKLAVKNKENSQYADDTSLTMHFCDSMRILGIEITVNDDMENSIFFHLSVK